MSLTKVCLLLVLVPYLCLVLIFHVRLQTSNTSPDTHQETEFSITRPAINSAIVNVTYRLRDLMLKDTNSDLYLAASDDQNAPPTQLDIPRVSAVGSNIADVIRVSRTFRNGTSRVFSERRDLRGDGAIRLQLDGSTDNVTRGMTHKLSAYFGDSAGTAQSGYSVLLPFSPQCRDYYRHKSHKLEDIGLFLRVSGVYLLSAYMDARVPEAPPFVRIMGLLKMDYRPQLYCHFQYVEGNNREDKNAYYATEIGLFYEMCENHNKEYGGWIVSCKVPSVFTDADRTPCEVVVSEQPVYTTNQAESGVHIPIFTTSSEQTDLNNNTNNRFAVCVPPLFGHIPSTTLVEFIELSRLLGANHVVFYAYQVTSAIQKVLDYYQDQGLVTVISWELPVRDKSIWYNGQLLAINDCLYRTMHRFTHVVFNDIDEFLVPHKQSSWADMSEALDITHTKSGYIFRSAFFDPLVNGNNVMYNIESDLRTKTFSAVRSKVMVRPQLVFELGIHHISRPVSPEVDHVIVHPDVAYIHHYRQCMTDFEPHLQCQVYVRDESMSAYIPALRHGVHRTLWLLKDDHLRHTLS